MSKAVVLVSGGQDSTTCLYWAKKKFDEVIGVIINYGQRHKVEIDCAERILSDAKVPFEIFETSIFAQLGDSALMTKQGVSELRNGLPASFVPGRNLFFLSVAGAYAYKVEADNIVMGVCQTDYSGYPDCRAETIKAMGEALSLGLDTHIDIHTPLMYKTKAETWKMAEELVCLEVVRIQTHTCYEGVHDELHDWGYGCGTCPACALRIKGWEEYQGSEDVGASCSCCR